MKVGMLALGSMETVSLLLWDSPKEWIGHLLKAGGGAQQAGDCTSQGLRSLEVGTLSVHTWLHLIAYLAPTLSHFLRKNPALSGTLVTILMYLVPEISRRSQRKISSIRGWWKASFVVWWSSSVSHFFLLTDSAFFQSACVETSGFIFASRCSSVPIRKLSWSAKKEQSNHKKVWG